MTDLATLGIAIDSRPAVKAASDLDTLSQSAKRAEQSSGAFEAAARRMGMTVEQYTRYGREAAAVQERMGQTMTESRRASEELGNAVGSATRATDQLEGSGGRAGATFARYFLSTAIVAGISAIGAAAVSLHSQLLNVEDVANLSGMAIERLGLLQRIGQDFGVGTEETSQNIRGLAEKLNDAQRNANSLTRLFKENGIAIRDNEGAVIGVDTALERMRQLIFNARTELDKIEIAKMAGLTENWVQILDRSKGSFDALIQSAREAGSNIDENMVQSARKFSDWWNTAWTDWSTWGKAKIYEVASAMKSLFLDIASQLQAAANNPGGFWSGLHNTLMGRNADGSPRADGGGGSGGLPVITVGGRRNLRDQGGEGAGTTNVPRRSTGAANDNQADDKLEVQLRQLRERTELFRQEAADIGLNTLERERNKAITQALNADRRDEGDLSERFKTAQDLLTASTAGLSAEMIRQRQEILDTANAYAAAADAAEKAKEAQRRYKEMVSFGASTLTGFISDLRGQLAQGKNFFEALGTAGLNALNKIADKLIQMAVENLFAKAFGGAGTNLLSSLFGGGGGYSTGGALASADGNIFSYGGVQAFAMGGAFTNSIVSKPTLFPFANGTGLMGEAGPEAIMPLRRDGQGRLGVMAANQNGPVTVHMGDTVITIQGGADKDTVAALRAELDARDKRLMAAVPAAMAKAKRDRVAA
jgi:lambda family phage tail tape measure protein